MWIKKVTDIPVDLIVTNPDQPRKCFGEEELLELRDSIVKYGVIQPIILKKAKQRTLHTDCRGKKTESGNYGRTYKDTCYYSGSG